MGHSEAWASVALERERQTARWGVQDHPDGTGLPGDTEARNAAQAACDQAFREGRGTWRAILAEEVAEAFAERDPLALRAELVQVAAVAIQWVEALDRATDSPAPGRGA